jgi:hypothetical protein
MPGLLTRLAPRKLTKDKASGYAVAVLATAVAAGLRLSLVPVLGTADPWILFVVAAGCAGWAGRLGPAMLAAALSVAVVTTTLLGPPPATYSAELTYLRVFAFLFVSALVSVVGEAFFRQRIVLRRHTETIEAINKLAADFAYAFEPLGGGDVSLSYITDGVHRLTGYGPDELCGGQNLRKEFHPDESTRLDKHIAAAFAGELASGQLRLLAKSACLTEHVEDAIRVFRVYARPMAICWTSVASTWASLICSPSGTA